jgi:Ca2+-dependent lipid-binding protein
MKNKKELWFLKNVYDALDLFLFGLIISFLTAYKIFVNNFWNYWFITTTLLSYFLIMYMFKFKLKLEVKNEE